MKNSPVSKSDCKWVDRKITDQLSSDITQFFSKLLTRLLADKN